jgi:hypothetical protein
MATVAGGIEPEFRKPKGVALLRNQYFNVNSLPRETPRHEIENWLSSFGTRMGQQIDLAEFLSRHHRVNLGCRHRGVAQQFLNHAQVRTAVKQVRRT